MQRLFTTFANGWPGFGLLMKRMILGITLLYRAAVLFSGHPVTLQMALYTAGGIFGLFILAGLWTPIAGTLIAVVELWIAFTTNGDRWMPIILAVLGATLAMIGPGWWSIDARLFGRKRIQN